MPGFRNSVGYNAFFSMARRMVQMDVDEHSDYVMMRPFWSISAFKAVRPNGTLTRL